MDLLIETGLTGAKPADSPLSQGTSFTFHVGASLSHPESYRRLLGKLLYSNFTRPNIRRVVHNLSQFVGKPCELHWGGCFAHPQILKRYTTP